MLEHLVRPARKRKSIVRATEPQLGMGRRGRGWASLCAPIRVVVGRSRAGGLVCLLPPALADSRWRSRLAVASRGLRALPCATTESSPSFGPGSLVPFQAAMALIPDKITFKRVTEKESICYR